MSHGLRHRARISAAGVACLLGMTLLGVLPGGVAARASTPAPTFSATSVCINGAREFAFTVNGLPSGQQTVTFSVLDPQADVEGGEVTLVPGVSTFLYNMTSVLQPPGEYDIGMSFGSTPISATNLTPETAFQFPIPHSYFLTLVACGSASPRIVALQRTPDDRGYWETTADAQVLGFGDAFYFGSMSGAALTKPIVGMAATFDGAGYWLVAADGGVFAFGDAGFFGSAGAIRLNRSIVGMAPTPDGKGYWLVAADGGVFGFGDATYFNSLPGLRVRVANIVGVAASSDGAGYWMVGSDGGVFSFGDAFFFGTTATAPTA